MTQPREFIYWLQGVFEVADLKVLTEAQVSLIRAKLEDCFEKVTQPVTVKPPSETGMFTPEEVKSILGPDSLLKKPTYCAPTFPYKTEYFSGECSDYKILKVELDTPKSFNIKDYPPATVFSC